MRNRYQKPADKAPSPRFFEAYLRDAGPTMAERLAEPEAAEARRVEAVAALLTLARAALANADEWNNMLDGRIPERGSYLLAIPQRLRRFLEIHGLRILTAEDPIAALQRFLGDKPRERGRPQADNAFRDRTIAADVAEMHAGGMSLAAAYEEVSKRKGTPGVKAIERIYLRLRYDLAVRADLEWRLYGEAGWLAEGN
jgi:hypothetical protein